MRQAGSFKSLKEHMNNPVLNQVVPTKEKMVESHLVPYDSWH